MNGECLKVEAFPGYLRLEVVAAEVDAGTKRQLAAELADVSSELGWNEGVRAVVLAFSGELLSRIGSAHRELEGVESVSPAHLIAEITQPVIGVVEGDCLGFALELALACDVRIGAEGARFGLPQVREGQLPSDGGTQRLGRLVGQAAALEMVLTGEPLPAAEALRRGLLNRVVAAGELARTAASLAEAMAGAAPFSLKYAKEALHKGADLTLAQGLAMERDLYLLMYSTQDRVEGITAFKEKRPPKFQGR